jgi:hypothetical protein
MSSRWDICTRHGHGLRGHHCAVCPNGSSTEGRRGASRVYSDKRTGLAHYPCILCPDGSTRYSGCIITVRCPKTDQQKCDALSDDVRCVVRYIGFGNCGKLPARSLYRTCPFVFSSCSSIAGGNSFQGKSCGVRSGQEPATVISTRALTQRSKNCGKLWGIQRRIHVSSRRFRGEVIGSFRLLPNPTPPRTRAFPVRAWNDRPCLGILARLWPGLARSWRSLLPQCGWFLAGLIRR